MLMPTLTHRLQVLLDEERFVRLEQLAHERKTTVAALVREALDLAYASDTLPPVLAAERFLGREPIDLGLWDDAKSEIEQSYGRGLA
jgi:hypothetical protein